MAKKIEKNGVIENRLTDNEMRQIFSELQVLSASIISRSELFSRYGDQNDGNRNIYKACGYKLNLDYDDFYSRYKRQDIAKRIINAPVQATWRLKPKIYDDEDEKISTPFEQKWEELVKRLKIWHYFSRVDKLAGIGKYAILFLGFNDGEIKLDQEVQKGKDRDLLYIFPYAENAIDIFKSIKDKNNPRYGLPEVYQLKMKDVSVTSSEQSTINTLVHYSRLIHIVQEPLESDIEGVSQLEDIWNRLHDLEKIVGGSGEMFWIGGFPGYAFIADSDTQIEPSERDDLIDQIKLYMHKLQRFLRLRGMKVDSLAPQVADPTNHAMIQLKIITGTKGIPIRILIGSERGELASTQDDKNWNSRTDERRTDYAEPVIIRPFIDRLITYGVLPEPKRGEYFIDWPDIDAPSAKEKAEVAKTRMEALRAYLSAPGSSDVYPEEKFLAREMELTQDEIKEILDDLEKILDKEEVEREKIKI